MTLAENLTSIQTFLTYYILPICFTFGIIGNLLNIVVFCRKHLRTNSCSIYFLSTSIFNCLVMCFGMIPTVVASYLSYDLSSYSILYCKFRVYIVHALLMMSRSSVALACIDRFALCSPNARIHAFSQCHIAKRSVIVVCFVWLLIPIHMLVEVNIQIPQRRCGATGTYSIIYGVYSAIVTAIPLMIMVTFTSMVLRNLQYVRSRVHPNILTRDRIKKQDAKFIKILISEVIIYFLSTVLFPVFSIYAAITLTIDKRSDRVAVETFMRYIILSFLIYVNSSSIFYIHLLASKAFRQECKQLILNLYKSK